MKILIISNTDGALYVFRKQLLKRLIDEKHHVVSITSAGRYLEKLSAMGVRTLTTDFFGTSASFAANFRLLLRLGRLLSAEKPEIVHNFAHKAAVFGTIAARLSGVKEIFVTITGLGQLFTYNDLRASLLRQVLLAQYRIVLRFTTKVFFLNSDDLIFFVEKGLITPDRAILLNGEGVDLREILAPTREEIREKKRMLGSELGIDLHGKIVVIFNSRALKEKGVCEFYDAAQNIRESSERYVFIHVGLIDPSPTAPIKKDTIELWSKKCGVHYLGFKDNIYDYITACDVAVLPSSYREGVPRSLIEALALDKFIITTDMPGCRDTVVDGWNGALCKPGKLDDLITKISSVDQSVIEQSRGRSRKFCEEKFDIEDLIRTTMNCYFAAHDKDCS